MVLSGDLLACGSHGGGDYDKSGSAYVFRYDGSSWVQQAKFVAPRLPRYHGSERKTDRTRVELF